MSFGLLSTFAVLLGIVLLAIGLWLLQRLRVQHREVTVLSTLFWQSAVEETRARVFVKRFRHWPAWVLLVAIASLLWMLLARPQSTSFDSTQHVVLIDRSVEDDEIRADDFELAIQRAASLPTSARRSLRLTIICKRYWLLANQRNWRHLESITIKPPRRKEFSGPSKHCHHGRATKSHLRFMSLAMHRSSSAFWMR